MRPLLEDVSFVLRYRLVMSLSLSREGSLFHVHLLDPVASGGGLTTDAFGMVYRPVRIGAVFAAVDGTALVSTSIKGGGRVANGTVHFSLEDPRYHRIRKDASGRSAAAHWNKRGDKNAFTWGYSGSDVS